MKGFMIDQQGDVVIRNRDVVMVSGNELLRQKVQSVLQTNLGEWFLNEEEGVDFKAMLKKMPDYDEIRNEILSGLQQVDETFELEEYEYELNDRRLSISFTARNGGEEAVSISVDYS